MSFQCLLLLAISTVEVTTLPQKILQIKQEQTKDIEVFKDILIQNLIVTTDNLKLILNWEQENTRIEWEEDKRFHNQITSYNARPLLHQINAVTDIPNMSEKISAENENNIDTPEAQSNFDVYKYLKRIFPESVLNSKPIAKRKAIDVEEETSNEIKRNFKDNSSIITKDYDNNDSLELDNNHPELAMKVKRQDGGDSILPTVGDGETQMFMGTFQAVMRPMKLPGVAIPEKLDETASLKDFGIEGDKIQTVCNLLRVHYNIAFEEEQIPLLTIETIQELDKTITETDFEDVKGLSTFINYVDSDELQATTEIVFLPTLTNSASMRDDELDVYQPHLCIVPGIEGHHERFRVLCERLKLPALVLQPGLDQLHETVRETAERHAEVILKKMAIKNSFHLLGYESGIFIALEVAAILEDHGLTGTIYCLGHAPAELEEQLKLLIQFETEEQLQDAVARHMFTLMATTDTAELESALRAARTWSEKVDACVVRLRGRMPHSAQYARALIEAALARISRARGYVPPARALRSQLVLLRAATQQHAPATCEPRPTAVHQLRAPLAHAASDLRCAAIINAYLDPVILEEFEKKNICDTYLINANSYMSVDIE